MKKLYVGTKIFSSNKESYSKAGMMLKEKVIDFLELYYVPGTLDDIDYDSISSQKIIIHAPHCGHDFNAASAMDMKIIRELEELGRKIDYEHMIFHPGIKDNDGTIENTIKNIKSLRLKNVIIENMPLKLPYKDTESVASTPDDFRRIVGETGCGFCLDFSHAVCSANSHGKDPIYFIKEFLKLSPSLFHLSDGDLSGWKDVHMHLGKGSFPLKEFTGLLPDGSYITLETPKKDFVNLKEDIENVKRFKEIMQ